MGEFASPVYFYLVYLILKDGSSLMLTNHFLYKQEAVKIAERISDTLGLQGDVEVINDPSKLTGKSD